MKKNKKINLKSPSIISAIIIAIATIIAAIIRITPQSPIKVVSTGNSNKITVDSKKVDAKKDYVQGNKIETTINAPKALIVTQNQTGNNNIINQISSQDYKQLTESQREQVIENLKQLIREFSQPPKIFIEIESGNSMRNKVAYDLETLLKSFNLGQYAQGNTYIGRFPDHPITIICNSQNKEFVDKFIKAIEPYIKCQYYIDSNTIFSTDIIKFYINGTPSFEMDGRVQIVSDRILKCYQNV
ncbi:MAG: hypothetical protein WC614_01650 [bacterium]